MKNRHSVDTECKVSDMLSHKRLLLAREFSKILTGQVYVSKFFNNQNTNGMISYEAFIRFLHLFAFIALHRIGYKVIGAEVNRLFRSSHFKGQKIKEELPFSLRERQVLFGENEPKESCYYFANSPLMAEIANVKRSNKELLWIGESKYMG